MRGLPDRLHDAGRGRAWSIRTETAQVQAVRARDPPAHPERASVELSGLRRSGEECRASMETIRKVGRHHRLPLLPQRRAVRAAGSGRAASGSPRSSIPIYYRRPRRSRRTIPSTTATTTSASSAAGASAMCQEVRAANILAFNQRGQPHGDRPGLRPDPPRGRLRVLRRLRRRCARPATLPEKTAQVGRANRSGRPSPPAPLCGVGCQLQAPGQGRAR